MDCNENVCHLLHCYAILCLFLRYARTENKMVRKMTQESWVSLDEIADHLGVSRDTVYRWIDNRGMPAHKVGRLWKFKVSQVDEWVEAGKAGDDTPKN